MQAGIFDGTFSQESEKELKLPSTSVCHLGVHDWT